MPIWKLQTAIWNDSVLARDAFVITPHFNDSGVGTDPDSLCEDLADAIDTLIGASGAHQIEVKAYDAQGSVPVFPQGQAIRNVGGAPASSVPREVACCLSFYSERNRPRYRGRLYIPLPILGLPAGVRPSTACQDAVGAFAQVFQDLGGVDVDWSVFSRADNVARPVTNWWVDNEWDTIRSRGLRATGRIVGVTSEG